jgi:serine/threonine-protein kinase SRK2
MACQNLLAQMLLPSPEQRITVAEILRHPWFLRDLPPGTELVNERLQHDVHAR